LYRGPVGVSLLASIGYRGGLVGKVVDELVTVAMTLKDAEETIGDALDAIHDLAYPKGRIKLVFVDGGSTDNSVKILRDFLDKKGNEYYKPELISKPCGITEGRNICLDLAEGYSVILVDSDVLAPPGLVSKSLEMLKSGNIAFINVACVVRKEGRGWLDEVYVSLDEPVGMSCAVILRSALEKVGNYFTGLPGGENPAELIFRLSKRGYRSVNTTDIQAVHIRPPVKIRYYWENILIYSAEMDIPLLLKRDIKTILRYVYYSLLLASIPLAYWNWLPAVALLAIGVAYQLKKGHGRPHALLFLTGGLLLPITLIYYLLKRAMTRVRRRLR